MANLGGAERATTSPAVHSASPWDWSAASDPGLARNHNEDAWRVAPPAGLFLLADGMGGYSAGDVASSLAVDGVLEALGHEFDVPAGCPERLALLQRAIGSANAAILAAAARRTECLGMGTTLTCAWVDERVLSIGHIGDSRIYLSRGGMLYRLTRDHSVGQAMVDAGVMDEQAAGHASLRGVLTRALGVEPAVQADVGQVELKPGDRLLLCSDGLSDVVDHESISGAIANSRSSRQCADDLVAAALAAGGHDNVTVLVAFFCPVAST